MDFLANINSSYGMGFVIIRSIILFIVGIFLIRYGNRRYHLNSAFDFLLLIIVGGLLSRGINGTATLASTIAATLALVLLHRLIAMLTFYFKNLEFLFKGKSHLIIKDGKIIKKQLKKYHLTEMDILMEMRTQIHADNFEEIKCAYLESTGKLSFIEKE